MVSLIQSSLIFSLILNFMNLETTVAYVFDRLYWLNSADFRGGPISVYNYQNYRTYTIFNYYGSEKEIIHGFVLTDNNNIKLLENYDTHKAKCKKAHTYGDTVSDLFTINNQIWTVQLLHNNNDRVEYTFFQDSPGSITGILGKTRESPIAKLTLKSSQDIFSQYDIITVPGENFILDVLVKDINSGRCVKTVVIQTNLFPKVFFLFFSFPFSFMIAYIGEGGISERKRWKSNLLLVFSFLFYETLIFLVNFF
ncbi:expressed protein [Phakopsora pachyrhizi]|uniref:Expressed protein n=1 Tax=Phakopsora pachyrhizi TaxID=170000 RepID=A0AAV0AN10_PHAPC|nr:expressed protein [Phakopsora pachyrhizi]